MTATTANTGELTAEQVHKVLTAPLETQSVFLAAGPRIFDTNGSPIRIPSAPKTKADTLAWTGEGEQIGEQDYEFDEVTLMPSTMKSVKVITRYSNELARQTIVSLDAVLRARLVADVAAKIDAQFMGAGGDGVTTPQGIFGWEGTQAITGVGALSLDALMDAQALALAANVDPSKLVLFLRSADYMALRKLKDGDGRYMLSPDATGGNSMVSPLGFTAKVSNRIPAGRAALVDMGQVAVARDLTPSVKILTELYAGTDEQGIRVVARYDSGTLNPEGVITLAGITPALP